MFDIDPPRRIEVLESFPHLWFWETDDSTHTGPIAHHAIPVLKHAAEDWREHGFKGRLERWFGDLFDPSVAESGLDDGYADTRLMARVQTAGFAWAEGRRNHPAIGESFERWVEAGETSSYLPDC